VRPLDLERAYLFGEETPGVINNAILRVPADSPMIPLLLEPFEKGRTPRGLHRRQYWPLRVAEVLRGAVNPARLPWGSTGPLAVSHLARRFGMSSKALPPEVFYPVSWREADWIVDPAQKLADKVSEATVAIHLWNECIKNYKQELAPKGSFLHRLQHEGRR